MVEEGFAVVLPTMVAGERHKKGIVSKLALILKQKRTAVLVATQHAGSMHAPASCGRQEIKRRGWRRKGSGQWIMTVLKVESMTSSW